MSRYAVPLPIVVVPDRPFPDFLPQKPDGMSETLYRELHDSQPVAIELESPKASGRGRTRVVASGLVSAAAIAQSYYRDGFTVTIAAT